METLQVENPTNIDVLQENVLNQKHADELTLIMKTENVQESLMSETSKQEKRAGAPSLETLFEQTAQRKGEAANMKKSWVSDSAMEVEGLSNNTLHSFVLEAEKLGKKITYTRTLQVKISD
ncbi:MAG: hypothetical protein R8G66_17965 [Cytophagales bacterium]|nr:hypothetical protein [Cytophagales bacterium]